MRRSKEGRGSEINVTERFTLPTVYDSSLGILQEFHVSGCNFINQISRYCNKNFTFSGDT